MEDHAESIEMSHLASAHEDALIENHEEDEQRLNDIKMMQAMGEL